MKLSVVLPVHDGQDRIEAEVLRLLDKLSEVVSEALEIVVVDDGSRDRTAEVLDHLSAEYPQVRVARHSRRLGMEAAGQTGLQRAVGELIFVQEEDSPLRIASLRHLYEMSRDETVVAARAQGNVGGPSRQPLLRRLRAWGARTGGVLSGDSLDESDAPSAGQVTPGLQMLRRSQLQQLTAGRGAPTRLAAERLVRSGSDSALQI